MGAASTFSLLFADQLKGFGLNPFEWRFDTWICLREKSFVLHHKDEPEFRLKGHLERKHSRAPWTLGTLAIESI